MNISWRPITSRQSTRACLLWTEGEFVGWREESQGTWLSMCLYTTGCECVSSVRITGRNCVGRVSPPFTLVFTLDVWVMHTEESVSHAAECLTCTSQLMPDLHITASEFTVFWMLNLDPLMLEDFVLFFSFFTILIISDFALSFLLSAYYHSKMYNIYNEPTVIPSKNLIHTNHANNSMLYMTRQICGQMFCPPKGCDWPSQKARPSLNGCPLGGCPHCEICLLPS